jgi:hypothetical protein
LPLNLVIPTPTTATFLIYFPPLIIFQIHSTLLSERRAG